MGPRAVSGGRPGEYAAFVSYAHFEEDRKWAEWLTGALRRYRSPRRLAGKRVRSRIGDVFLDDHQLGTAPHLSEALRDCLDRSRHLILVCSPRTPQSEWVAAEVDYFLSLGRRTKIITFLIEGEPEDSFPEGLLSIRSSESSDEAAGEPSPLLRSPIPLAADARGAWGWKGRHKRRVALLRVAHSILLCGFDDLWVPDQRRRVRALLLTSVAFLLLASVLAAISLYARGQAALADRERELAERQRNDSRAELDLLRAAREDSAGNPMGSLSYACASLRWRADPSVGRSIWNGVIQSRLVEWISPNMAHHNPLGVAEQGRSGGGVHDVDYSDARGWILTAGEDDTVVLWDARTGARLRTLRGHTRSVYCARFSPDGSRVITGSGDRTLRIWNADTGEELERMRGDADWTGFQKYPVEIALSNSGRLLAASILAGKKIELRALGSSSLEREFGGLTGYASTVALSEEADLVVAGESSFDEGMRMTGEELEPDSGGGAVWVWRLSNGELLHRLEGHAAGVESVGLSAEGDRIASAGTEGKILLWDARSGELLDELQGCDGSIRTLQFAPATGCIAYGGDDGRVRLWDPGSDTGPVELAGHTDRVNRVRFVGSGSLLLSGSDDCTYRLRPVGGKPSPESGDGPDIIGHTDDVTRVRFHSGESRIYSAGSDNTVRSWDLATGAQIRIVIQCRADIDALIISPDGSRVICADQSGEIVVWDLREEIELDRFRLRRSSVSDLALSGDSQRLAVAHLDGHLDLVDLESKRVVDELYLDSALARIPEPLGDPMATLLSVASCPTKELIAIGTQDGILALYDAARREIVREELFGSNTRILSLEFSPDGSGLVAGLSDGTVRLWRGEAYTREAVLDGHDAAVRDVCFDPSGERIATGSIDGTVRVWDVREEELLWAFEGHDGVVGAVCFAGDPDRVVSGSSDNAIRHWRMPQQRSVVRYLEGHTAAVTGIAPLPSSSRVATASLDMTLRLWDLETGAELACSRDLAGGVFSLAADHEGEILASGGAHGSVVLSSAATGSAQTRISAHGDRVTSLDFSATEPLLASGSVDGTVLLWDWQAGRSVQRQALEAAVSCLAVGLKEGGVRIWEQLDGVWRLVNGSNEGAIQDLALADGGAALLLVEEDGRVRKLETETLFDLWAVETPGAKPCGLALHPRGGLLAAGRGDGWITFIETETGEVLRTEHCGFTGLSSLSYAPAGHALLLGFRSEPLYRWTPGVAGGRVPFDGHTSTLVSVAYSPHGSQLASCASGEADVLLWGQGPEVPTRRLPGGGARASALAYLEGGTDLVVGYSDGMVRRWDVAQQIELSRASGGTGPVFDLATSEATGVVVAACGGDSIRVWNRYLDEELAIIAGLSVQVREIDIDPSGRWLVSQDAENVVRLWDAANGQEIRRLEGYANSHATIAFDATGRRLISASGVNEPLKVWASDSGRLLQDLTPAERQRAWSSSLMRRGPLEPRGVRGLGVHGLFEGELEWTAAWMEQVRLGEYVLSPGLESALDAMERIGLRVDAETNATTRIPVPGAAYRETAHAEYCR